MVCSYFDVNNAALSWNLDFIMRSFKPLLESTDRCPISFVESKIRRLSGNVEDCLLRRVSEWSHPMWHSWVETGILFGVLVWALGHNWALPDGLSGKKNKK